MSVLNIKQEMQETNSNLNALTCYSPSSTSAVAATSSAAVTTTINNTSPTKNRRNSAGTAGSSSNGGLKSSPSVSPERQMCSSTTNLSNGSTTYLTAIDDASDAANTAATGSGSGSTTNSIRDELRRLCLVCGDIASGFHYGVASCEACKAFFKRTIQGNIEYSCPANNECEINKRRRKACQACRFQKCLLMGMLKEGVRLDRVRGGRQKYRRNPASNSYQTMQLLFQSCITSLSEVKILDVLSSYEPDILSVQNIGITTLHSNNTTESSINDDDESDGVVMTSPLTKSSPSIKLEQIEAINNGAVHNLTSDTSSPPRTPTTTTTGSAGGPAGKKSSTGLGTSSTPTNCIFSSSLFLANNNTDANDILIVLSDLYDRELVNVIAWAKQLPGFTELPLNDQMKLLQVSWAEILTLQLIFRSLPFNGKLCFANDVWMDELLAKECGYTEFYYHCVQVAQRLERISPRREEYYLLKALLLTNCDILLDDQSALRTFRDSVLSSLNDVVYLLRNSSAVSHQQQLLLLLPSLRQADTILRKFWRNINNEAVISLKKLFMEMLEPISR